MGGHQVGDEDCRDLRQANIRLN